MLLLALAACHPDPDVKDSAPPEEVPACEAPAPPAEATLPIGVQGDALVLPDGRLLTPAGVQVEVGGFPADVAIAGPGGRYALVTNAHRHERALDVVDRQTGALLTVQDRTDAYPGFAVSPDGGTIWASGGNSGLVDVWTIDADGALTAQPSLSIPDYPSGLALSADGATLYVARFLGDIIDVVDVATGTVTAEIPVSTPPYRLALDPARHQLLATGFADAYVMVVDLEAGAEVAQVAVGGNPEGIVTDGATAWVAVSNEDHVAAIDLDSLSVTGSLTLGEHSVTTEAGDVLPGTNPTAIAFDGATRTLYVTRAADNAVDVIDADALTVTGSIPVGWYPTGVVLAPDGMLVVSNGKGIGSGPNADDRSASDAMVGTVSLVTPDDASLAGWTAEVESNVRYPDEVYDFGDCAGTFPIPRTLGDPTPIQHVVLLVKENKTFDSELGDLPGAEGDPSLLSWGAEITPNLRSLATTFTTHDNFYDQSESSVQGHLWLTSSLVNDYMERAWIEDYHGVSTFADDAALAVGRPGFGSIFTHLLRYGVDFTDYGEIVGALDAYDDQPVMDHVDLGFPGGFFNTGVKDEDKARYVADRLVTDGDFPPFVYVLLPNDHPGSEASPESMISDNDYGMGLLVDAISHSPAWASTVIFVVEDDPQGEHDHVDAHRSLLTVISPYAKRGHVSHVRGGYPSVFRTIEAILGVPPMNREDALATPLWDSFTSVPDLTPYDVVAKGVADMAPPPGSPMAVYGPCVDLSGPDREPLMGLLVEWQRTGRRPAAWPEGGPCREAGEGDADEARMGEGDDGDDRDEADAYDAEWARFEAWKRAHPGVADHVVRPAGPRGPGAARR